VRSRTPHKYMPNPDILITNGLHHNGTLPVAILVHASDRLRAAAPLPVAAVKGAHATGHPALSIARQNSLQFFSGGVTQTSGSKLIYNKEHQLSQGHSKS